MTPSQKIKALAEKAMGWSNLYVVMKRGLYYRTDAKGYTSQISEAWKIPYDLAKEHEHLDSEQPVTIRPAWVVENWNPLTNPVDCAQLREKIYENLAHALQLIKLDGAYVCWAYVGPCVIQETGPTESAAVVAFACKLWGIE